MTGKCRSLILLALLLFQPGYSADPLETASPESQGLNAELLLDGVAKIENGKYSGIDSLLVLRHGKLVTWHVSEWQVPLVILGDEEEEMELVFHIAPSCGNDQIGGEVVVPAEESENSDDPTRDLT